MEINSVSAIRPLISHSNELVDLGNRLERNKGNEDSYFEKVFNSILGKELMKPLIESALLSGNQQYSYLIENTLVDYFSENYQLLDLGNGGMRNDK